MSKYTLKVPLQVFDIVQFSRSCVRRPVDRRPVYCSTARRFCQALFSSFFKRCRSALFFTGLSAGASRRVLAYSTTFSAPCQPLFSTFFGFDHALRYLPKFFLHFCSTSRNTIYCVHSLDFTPNNDIILDYKKNRCIYIDVYITKNRCIYIDVYILITYINNLYNKW